MGVTNVGDMVFMRLAPYRHIIRFKRKGKLAPRFIGPFKILKCLGKEVC